MTVLNDQIDPRRIPIYGDDIYQVGQIYRILDQSCAPNPLLMITAAFIYSPTLIWTLAKPEPLDAAFDRVGKPHKRKRRRKVPPSNPFQRLPSPTSKPGRALFSMADAGQRIGWYFLVLDATTDWVINWTSMAYTFAGCPSINTKFARNWGDGVPGIEPWATMPWTIVVDHSDSQGTGFASGSAVGILEAGPWSITYGVEILLTPYQGNIGVVSEVIVEIRLNNGPWGAYAADLGEPINDTTSATWGTESYFTLGVKIEARARVSWTDGRMSAKNQSLQLVAGPINALTYDP